MIGFRALELKLEIKLFYKRRPNKNYKNDAIKLNKKLHRKLKAE